MEPSADSSSANAKPSPFIPGWWHLLLALHWAVLVFVVPEFKKVYSDENQSLPAMTNLLLSLSDLAGTWPARILGVGLLTMPFFVNARIGSTRRSHLFFIATGIGMFLALGLVVLALRLPTT